MNRIFDISEAKQKRGFCWPAVLPRRTGKTKSIISSMEAGDICISPFSAPMGIFKERLIREKAIYSASYTWLKSDKGRMCVSTILDSRSLLTIFPGGCYNTVFVDEFLFYDKTEISSFMQIALRASNNVIMVSSDTYSGGMPEFLQNKKNIYYDEIRVERAISKYINLPDELFVI